MNISFPYSGFDFHRLLRSLPGLGEKLKELWEKLVDFWTNSILLSINDSYWAVSHSEQLLIAALAGLGFLLFLAAFLLLRRSRRKPKLSRKSFTPKDFKKAAKEAMRARDWVRAGEMFEKAGKPQKAVEMFQRGNAFSQAARVYAEKLNQPEKALEILTTYSLWDQAGKLLVKLERFSEAADMFLKAGKHIMAAEMLEKSGDFLRAGEAYRKAKMLPEAARCYVKAKAWKQAAAAYAALYKQFKNSLEPSASREEVEKMRELAKKAAQCFRQSGELIPAGELLLDAGLSAAAAQLFEQAGQYERAAELFLEANQYRKAAELFHKAGNETRAAELMASHYQAEGKGLEAAKWMVKAGDYLGAAEILAGQGDYLKAAELYLKGGDSRTAAEMFVAGGRADKAVEIYKNLGDMEAAVRLIEESGGEEELPKVYEELRRFYEAGVLYQERGLLDKAISAFQKVGPEHPRYADAQGRLGRIFMEKGEYQLALEKLQAMASRMPLSPATLEIYYLLGMAYERMEQLAYAAAVYQQIMALNFHYKDVAMRVQAIYHRLQQKGGAYAATVAGGGWGQKGQSIADRYTMLKELGRGGMGVVYLAEDTHLGRKVAFKVLPEELKGNRMMVENFLREARSLAKLTHPYIVAIYDAGEERGVYYIIMEYVEGRDFKQILKEQKRLPLAAGIKVFMQLCQAMDYAHKLKIIHRDIKPANIMWTKNDIIKVMDFGLAKAIDQMREKRTVIAGTPYYMSPEQTLGKPLDHRSDIYSVGVTMFELMTGRVPFKEGDIGYHHLHTPPPSPRELNPKIPPELEAIILKCMAKKPQDRYQSAEQIYEELLKFTQGRSI